MYGIEKVKHLCNLHHFGVEQSYVQCVYISITRKSLYLRQRVNVWCLESKPHASNVNFPFVVIHHSKTFFQSQKNDFNKMEVYYFQILVIGVTFKSS